MAKHEPVELTDEASNRITRVVRSLADDHVDRGVDLNRPMHCDSCGQEKPAAGSATYGPYGFCNDCLLDFTLSLASGKVDNAADFMTRRSDDSDALPPSDLTDRPDRSAYAMRNLQARDKLMPSNEPC